MPDMSVPVEAYTIWEHPTAQVTVLLHPELMSSLPIAALRALTAKPPAEIGGILLGKMVSGHSKAAVAVTAVEFVPSEGPLFNVTTEDIINLQTAFHCERDSGGLFPIGYFRSHIRDGLCLSIQDQQLINQSLRHQQAVSIIIRPYEMGICMAGLFLRENGELQADFTDFEFPLFVSDGHQGLPTIDQTANRVPTAIEVQNFAGTVKSSAISELYQGCISNFPSSGQLETESTGITRPAIANIAIRSPLEDGNEEMYLECADHLVNQSARNVAAGRSRLHQTKLLHLALIITTAGVSFFVAFWATEHVERHPAPKVSLMKTFEIGLQAIAHPEESLDIVWNRHLLEAGRLDSAQLTIRDGNKFRVIHINQFQLRSGLLMYLPSTNDIQLQLEVRFEKGRTLSESMQVTIPSSQKFSSTVKLPH